MLDKAFQSVSLTVLVPVYNEEGCLQRFRESMDAFLAQSPVPTQVLFVNDGSTDDSLRQIREICQGSVGYSYISLDRNHGLSTAIKAGIDYCQTSHIGYIDSDLQTSPLDFMLLLEHVPQHAMVIGIRAKRKDTFIKKISSKIANGFRQIGRAHV